MTRKATRRESPEDSYETFARRYFGAIYRWCLRKNPDEEQSAETAQYIVLELYRMRGRRSFLAG